MGIIALTLTIILGILAVVLLWKNIRTLYTRITYREYILKRDSLRGFFLRGEVTPIELSKKARAVVDILDRADPSEEANFLKQEVELAAHTHQPPPKLEPGTPKYKQFDEAIDVVMKSYKERLRHPRIH